MNPHTQVPGAKASPSEAQSQGKSPARTHPWVAVLFGGDRPTRIRVRQWLIAAAAYTGSLVVMSAGHAVDWVRADPMKIWMGCMLVTQTLFYIALRSGFSGRCKDPALTVLQILAGILLADWAFLIMGPGRAVAMMPILFILIFGAFLLHWKKMALLTFFAIASFGVAVGALQWWRATRGAGVARVEDAYQDLFYLGAMLVLLPLTGVLAAQLSRLRSTLRTQRGALAAALADVQRLAEFDDLTGLANRRRAGNYLATLQAQTQRNGCGFSVALIDLDHFKRINDTLGHEAGDHALRSFADAARPFVRAADLLARWGGEEFLFVMPDTEADAACRAVSRLLERVRELPAEQGGPISFSAGVVQGNPGEPIAGVVARADDLMYAAKRAGRNQICMAGEPVSAPAPSDTAAAGVRWA